MLIVGDLTGVSGSSETSQDIDSSLNKKFPEDELCECSDSHAMVHEFYVTKF